jgi:hypothetical protein
MPELWIPGAAGPQDELVKRIERRIEEFRTEHGLERAGVSVELAPTPSWRSLQFRR